MSVITIFLDAERFLEEAIESVRAQTFAGWELLLVDDGSGDRSPAIASAAAVGDERIRYLTHPGGGNHGMSASRNLGIRNARGSFFAFLDGDDVYLPAKLERQLEALEREPRASMVYGPSLLWYGWTGRPEDADRDRPCKLGVEPGTLVEPPAMLERVLRREAWSPATCSVLIRRAAIYDVGGFETAFTGMLEDQVFFYKLLTHHPVLVEGTAWDRARRHPDSCTERSLRTGAWHQRKPNSSHKALMMWFRRYLREQGIDDPSLWLPLLQMSAPYDHPIRHRLSVSARRFARRFRVGLLKTC